MQLRQVISKPTSDLGAAIVVGRGVNVQPIIWERALQAKKLQGRSQFMPSACSIVLIGLEPIWRRHTDTCSRSRTTTCHLNKGLGAWKARLDLVARELLLVPEGTHKISIEATFRCSRGFTSPCMKTTR